MILKRLKIFALTILGAPLMLLAPIFLRKMRKLEKQYENDPDSLPEEVRKSMYFTKLDDRAYEELEKGNYDLAKKLAKELLNLSNDFKDNWNYGNAIHHANIILGLISVKEGNVGKAVGYLKESGKTPGSPQLDSHGPSFCLAMELILLDRNDDVLDYLSQVEVFWEYGYKVLPEWRKTIESNDIPDNWQRLKY